MSLKNFWIENERKKDNKRNFPFLPSHPELELFQAALLDSKKGREAWECWQAKADIDQMGESVYRLMPLLVHNLSRWDVKHPWIERMKGVCRHTWTYNHLLMKRIAQLAETFHQHHVPFTLLKGVPLVLRYYSHFGLRVLYDADILVPPDYIERAASLLRNHGWVPFPERKHFNEALLHYQTAHCFKHKESPMECDLHWDIPTASDDASWLKRVHFCAYLGIAIPVLPAEELLAHILMHGATLTRWVPDAVMILRSQSIDFQRFLHLVARLEIHLPLKEMFTFIDRHFVSISKNFLEALHRLAISKRQKEFWRRGLKSEAIYSRYAAYWRGHSHGLSDRRLFFKLYRFPQFLKSLWEVESFWYLPLLACYKIGRSLRFLK